MEITPELFNKIALKSDLEAMEERIMSKMVTKDDFNMVMNTLDFIVKKFDDHEIEHISNIAAHDRFEESIGNLNRRVGKLETARV